EQRGVRHLDRRRAAQARLVDLDATMRGDQRVDADATAHVARAAARLDRLVEQSDERLMPAAAAVDQAEHLDRLAPRLLADRDVVDAIEERVVADHVGPRVEQHAIALEAVATSAADLLIPGFDALRHVAMHDEAYVALVDAHA